MRSYLSAVRQDLLVRDSPNAFAKGPCNSVVSLGFLTKSSPETCTILAARRMMSPREATLFRRGSQIERHDVFFITVWPAVPDGPPNRAGTYYRRSRNLPPRPLFTDLPLECIPEARSSGYHSTTQDPGWRRRLFLVSFSCHRHLASRNDGGWW